MNGYLLDTNVPSEFSRPRPDPRVVRWVRQAPQNEMFLSVISLVELTRGIARQRDPAQQQRLRKWFDLSIRQWFEHEMLAVSERIAERTGLLIGTRDRIGKPISLADATIAATALEYDLALVTRNVRDFEHPGLQVINPWI